MPKKGSAPDAAAAPAPAADTPERIRRNFRAVAVTTGAPMPAEVPSMPTADLKLPIGALGSQVGMLLSRAGLYRHSLGLVTVDDSGSLDIMTPERFCSWAEYHLAFVKWTDAGARQESIGKQHAGTLIASDQFRGQLPELKRIFPVRMPSWRGAGPERTVELAAPGFDQASGALTLNDIDFAEDMPGEDALRFMLQTLRHFGWEAEGETNYAKRRSFAVWLAVALGVFCDGLFNQGTAKPMAIFNGNQPGTGKSLLARMALGPVHGAIPEGVKPETEQELEKVLDSVAMARRPFLVLDDVADLRSPSLNKFVTSPVHEFRRMHSQILANVPRCAQVFVTGNTLRLTRDLERRAIIVDLFEAREATSRRFPHEITNEWLAMPETRAQFLASLWAFVARWRDAGMPHGPGRKPSFETWAGVIGGIVTTLAPTLADPFGGRMILAGGDESTRALERVLAIVAGRYESDDTPRPTTADIVEVADAENLTAVITTAKDPNKSIGGKLRPLRERQLVDTRGRLFEFGKRDLASGACYPITYLSPTPDDNPAPP